jgi:hypothetical protein
VHFLDIWRGQKITIRVRSLTTVPEPSVDQRTRTAADRYATIRKTVEATVDKTWLAANEKHMDFIIQRVISGRWSRAHSDIPDTYFPLVSANDP